MLCVDVGNLFVQLCQLHVVVVELVIIYYFIYFLHPLVVHEHLIVACCYFLLPPHKLLVLGFHLESVSFNVVALI